MSIVNGKFIATLFPRLTVKFMLPTARLQQIPRPFLFHVPYAYTYGKVVHTHPNKTHDKPNRRIFLSFSDIYVSLSCFQFANISHSGNTSAVSFCHFLHYGDVGSILQKVTCHVMNICWTSLFGVSPGVSANLTSAEIVCHILHIHMVSVNCVFSDVPARKMTR